MSGPIVCGVDDSTGSRDTVATALAVSVRAGLPLLFVHVAPDEPRLSRRDPERKRRFGESVSIEIEVLERATGGRSRPRRTHTRGAGRPGRAAGRHRRLDQCGDGGRRIPRPSRFRAAFRGSVSHAHHSVRVSRTSHLARCPDPERRWRNRKPAASQRPLRGNAYRMVADPDPDRPARGRVRGT
jgi:hypothetical protein